MKLTTPTKKEAILETIYTLWNDATKDFTNNPNDRYYRGRYAAVVDLLEMIKIYEKD